MLLPARVGGRLAMGRRDRSESRDRTCKLKPYPCLPPPEPPGLPSGAMSGSTRIPARSPNGFRRSSMGERSAGAARKEALSAVRPSQHLNDPLGSNAWFSDAPPTTDYISHWRSLGGACRAEAVPNAQPDPGSVNTRSFKSRSTRRLPQSAPFIRRPPLCRFSPNASRRFAKNSSTNPWLPNTTPSVK